MLAGMIDWTQVLVFGVPAYIAAIGAPIAAVLVARNGRRLQTPSGQSVGKLAERTHHLAEVNAARSARLDKAANGGVVADEADPGA